MRGSPADSPRTRPTLRGTGRRGGSVRGRASRSMDAASQRSRSLPTRFKSRLAKSSRKAAQASLRTRWVLALLLTVSGRNPIVALACTELVSTDETPRDLKGWRRSKANEYSNAIRAEPHRVLAHRRRADSPVQLAIRPSPRRQAHPSHRRHRSATSCRERGRQDRGWISLDRDRLG